MPDRMPDPQMQPLQKAILTGSVMLAALMQALDTTIANVALPHIQGSLSASQDEINWVLTSYITSSAIMTLPTGWLSSRFGSKKIFTSAIIGFILASVLCGMATSLTEIVLFRLLQGGFGAMLVPLSQSILLDINPPAKHGLAMALWGMGVMIGPVVGPSLGGYLTDNYSWRWVFYINVPIGIVAFLGILFYAKESNKKTTPFDFIGFTLFAIFIAGLQLLLDRGNSLDWFDSGEINFYLITAICSFWIFSCYLIWSSEPFVHLSLLKDRNFLVSLILIFILGTILLATMALLPPFLQNLLNYPVTTVGLIMIPRGVATMVAMMIVGRLIGGRVDPRLFITLGICLTAFSLWQLSSFNLNVSQMMIIQSGIMQGLGFGFIFVPLSTVAFATLPAENRLEATGLYNLLRNIGSSVGISVISTILSRNIQINHEIISRYISIFNVNNLIKKFSFLGNSFLTIASVIDVQIGSQSQLIAYLDCFKLMMLVMIVSLPLILLFSNKKKTGIPEFIPD